MKEKQDSKRYRKVSHPYNRHLSCGTVVMLKIQTHSRESRARKLSPKALIRHTIHFSSEYTARYIIVQYEYSVW